MTVFHAFCNVAALWTLVVSSPFEVSLFLVLDSVHLHLTVITEHTVIITYDSVNLGEKSKIRPILGASYTSIG